MILKYGGILITQKRLKKLKFKKVKRELISQFQIKKILFKEFFIIFQLVHGAESGQN